SGTAKWGEIPTQLVISAGTPLFSGRALPPNLKSLVSRIAPRGRALHLRRARPVEPARTRPGLLRSRRRAEGNLGGQRRLTYRCDRRPPRRVRASGGHLLRPFPLDEVAVETPRARTSSSCVSRG